MLVLKHVGKARMLVAKDVLKFVENVPTFAVKLVAANKS
jgi:hypothetical protein